MEQLLLPPSVATLDGSNATIWMHTFGYVPIHHLQGGWVIVFDFGVMCPSGDFGVDPFVTVESRISPNDCWDL